MADDPGDDGYFSGQMQNRQGMLMMYLKNRSGDSGHWVKIANFTLIPKFHSLNEVDGSGTFMIFEAKVKDGSSFYVPLTAADLDSNSSVISVIDPLKRPHDGTIDKEWLGRGSSKAKLNRFLNHLIKKYKEDPVNQSGAIVMKSTGFINMKINNTRVTAYCLGPDSVVPVGHDFGPEIDAMPKIWIGPLDAEKFVLPPNMGLDIKEFLRGVVQYHGINGASPLCALGYSWLMMFKPQLHSRGLKVGLLHVVGDVNTGKSAMREMLARAMPSQQTKEGLEVKEEPTLSVYSLQQMITLHRHVIIQDPPTTDHESMNKFMDQFFENKTEIKGGAKKGASRHQPACGGIFIWPHEERLLGKFSLTSITKGLFLLHNRNNYPYETFVDLEKAWRAAIPSAAGLFCSLLQSPDFKKLETEADALVVKYHQELKTSYSGETLNENNRVLRQYAVLAVATKMLMEYLQFPAEQAHIDQYIRETCIPYVLGIIEERKRGNVTFVGSPEEKLVRVIENLPDHEFLCKVTAPEKHKHAHCIGFVQSIYAGSKDMKALICSLSTEQARKAVLSTESREIWFKRDSTSHLYGKSSRLEVHLCPISNLPPRFREALTTKFQDLLPDSPNLNLSQNIKKLMDETFSKMYLAQRGPRGRLEKSLAMLDDAETKEVEKFVENLILKRKPLVSDDESSDSEEEGDNSSQTGINTDTEDQIRTIRKEKEPEISAAPQKGPSKPKEADNNERSDKEEMAKNEENGKKKSEPGSAPKVSPRKMRKRNENFHYTG